MRTTPHYLVYIFVLFFCASQLTSCSKDSDLLSDFVLNEEVAGISKLVVNDYFYVAPGQTTVLDVLHNDQFTNVDNVTVISTTPPQNGTVNINEDNTITYTPNEISAEETEDTFNYTTEETNSNGETTTEDGTVIVSSNDNKAPTSGANVFYVTTSGKSNNSGKSESSAWTLTHAFKIAKAGDIIHVKSGNYGAVQINTTKSGTADKPIKFIGYTNSPNDVLATKGPTFTWEDWKAAGNDLPDNIMPHLELNPSNSTPGTREDAFNITHEYIEIHNFMISEYMIGVDVRAPNVTINNIVGDQFGNWNSNAKGWNGGSSFANENNNGYGMNINGGNVIDCTITNNLIINAGHVSYFFVGGGSHTINNNVGVAHDTGNGSDYIFDFYTSSNNIAHNNMGIRDYAGDAGHRSRGLILQAQSDNNTVTNFTSINCRVQIENSNDNSIKGLDMYTINGASGENSVSIQIYAQADNNVIENYSIKGGGGISFLGGTGENQRFPHTSSGERNYFINGKISDLITIGGNAVISYHRLSGNDRISAGKNYIIGLTANNFGYLINANRAGNIQVYNSSFSNGKHVEIDTYYKGWSDYTNMYNIDFYNSNFYNNKFPTPTGTDISTGNPLLNSNLEPQSGSALINSGMNASTLKSNASKDFNGSARDFPYDIGALEY